MDKLFNPNRLKLARLRRKMTLKALADAIGMSTKMISTYEKEHSDYIPTEDTLAHIGQVLAYPIDFFYGKDIERLQPETVSFRSLSSMKAAQQHAAIAAGEISFLLSDYFASRFSLPESDLPDYRGYTPEAAAEAIRNYWGIGQRSIKNLVHLLESKGVRVFSLSENNDDVDAFSFWKDGIPFIFLNTQKSAERSRFDAAHELGHLLLHRHGTPTGRDAESEADSFASALLMPRNSVIEFMPRFATLQNLVKLKKHWLVSVAALIVRMKHLELLTEWQYRTLMIESSQLGYRKSEPETIERERSLIVEKILPALKSEGIDLSLLAQKLGLPLDEVSGLLFRPAVVVSNNIQRQQSPLTSRPVLELVKS